MNAQGVCCRFSRLGQCQSSLSSNASFKHIANYSAASHLVYAFGNRTCALGFTSFFVMHDSNEGTIRVELKGLLSWEQGCLLLDLEQEVFSYGPTHTGGFAQRITFRGRRTLQILLKLNILGREIS